MADGGFPDRRPGRFATTRWTLVVAAGEKSTARSADALASLCEQYWYPVYGFIRRQGHPAEDAADLTQEFFARVLEKGFFHDADPAKGRFRAFLCGSIRHFLSNQRDRARALKRGGSQPPLSLDVDAAEGALRLEPRDDLTPELLFDRRWALLLLDRVVARLRDHHVSQGKAEIFDGLKGCLTGDTARGRHADVGRDLGMTEGAVRVATHRLRRQFRDMLMEEIAETVTDPADIPAEIAYLLKAVRA
jgi:RNA polymerase sigma-70 factor (ECF subfamily)